MNDHHNTARPYAIDPAMMKGDASHQREAHYFRNQVNEAFAQCVRFDGNTRYANLNGIE